MIAILEDEIIHKKDNPITEYKLFESIKNYIEQTKYPKNLVISKLVLAKKSYIHQLDSLQETSYKIERQENKLKKEITALHEVNVTLLTTLRNNLL